MEFCTLRRAISLLLKVRKDSSSIRMLHELLILWHGVGISGFESCEVTINRLKMELESKVERTGGWRRIVTDFARTVCFNEMLDGFTESWVSRLSKSLSRHPSLRSSSIGVVS